MATLALARHDFRGGLRHAERARRLGPQLARPFSVLVDAQLELGRYEQAGRSLQQMIDLQPNLASYARVSYFRELHGDLAGAASAMRLAVSAGAGAPENVAYVQTLLGDLQALRGRPAAARRAYAAALAGVAGYVPALASRAVLDGAIGRLKPAIRTLTDIVRRRPLPQYVIALGEIQQVAGRTRTPARRSRSSTPSGGCWPRAASTPTSRSRCSRPSTAIAGARSMSRGGRGGRRRACAPRMP